MDSRNVDIFECEQRTAEWYALKCGVPSASNFDGIIKKLKNGNYSMERQKCLYKIVAEQISGKLVSTYFNLDMERGTILEDEAKSLYEMIAEVNVDSSVGFMIYNHVGYSPDGLVGNDGLIEIKSPRLENHLATLDMNKMPHEHMAQVQGGLYISNRKWCDFISYAQDMPIFIDRIYRDDEYIENMATELEKFCGEVVETKQRIMSKHQPPA